MVESSFRFNVSSMCYLSSGELQIALSEEGKSTEFHFVYMADLGNSTAEEYHQNETDA